MLFDPKNTERFLNLLGRKTKILFTARLSLFYAKPDKGIIIFTAINSRYVYCCVPNATTEVFEYIPQKIEERGIIILKPFR